jgi:hypothetical protein
VRLVLVSHLTATLARIPLTGQLTRSPLVASHDALINKVHLANPGSGLDSVSRATGEEMLDGSQRRFQIRNQILDVLDAD